MSRPRSAFRDRAEELLVALAAAPIGWMSPESAERLGRRLGALLLRAAPARRALVRRNLARAFPDKSEEELDALLSAVFAHFGGMSAELLATLEEPLEALLARIEIRPEEIELARAAVASGRGLFFLTPHLGNWEMAALVGATLGLPMSVIVRPLDNARLELRLRAFRERSGNVVVPKGEAAREILKVLRRGGTVGILIDQHARGTDAVAAPFFGRPAATSSALARLMDRTEALVLPAAAIRTGPTRYRLTFEELIDVRRLTAEERRPEALTARLNATLETQIRRAPEQWLWLHNRWRLD